MNLKCVLVSVASCAIVTGVAAADNSDLHWANWRGPEGTGFATNATPPLEWSEETNIRWKTEIPGEGYASPIVVGERVYLLTAVKTERTNTVADDGQDEAASLKPAQPQGRQQGRQGRRGPAKPANFYKFQVVAVDRASGKIIWNTTVREEVPHEGKHQTGSFAPNSAVSDGEHLFAHFGSRGLFCLDLNGKVIWKKDLGDMRIRNGFGEGASPALHGQTLVVPWDHEGDSFVVALNKSTGKELWRVARNEATTWSTPVIADVNGSAQAILAGTKHCIGYDLKTGDVVWRCSGLTTNVCPTPMVAHGNVYLMSGFRGSSVMAVNLEAASGDVTDTEAVIWHHERGTPYVPSGMVAGERLYFLGSNNGILSCFNAISGEQHYIGERLGDVRNVYASIVGAGGYLYVCGREGNVAVIRDAPEFELVRTNTLTEGINATPAIVGDAIYIRGDKHLYCIAAGKPATQ